MPDIDITKKAFVIGARETVRGFQLIGVPGKEVSNPNETLDVLEEALNKNYSLIVISASTAYPIEVQLEERRLDTPIPIVVVSDVNMKLDKKDLEKKFRQFFGF